MASMGGLLFYLKGLKAGDGKLASTFGTYGWAGGSQKDMEEMLPKAKFALEPGLFLNWVAEDDELTQCEEFGYEFAKKALAKK
jgi:flavorubredoxin